MRKSKYSEILTKEFIEEQYEKLGSLQKIADNNQISVDTIYKYAKLYNIEYSKTFKAQYKCNHNFFSTINEQSMYLAGFLAADGSIQNRKYSDVLKICLSEKDKDHLIKLQNLLDSNHQIFTFKVEPNKLVKTEHISVEFAIASRQICKDLAKFNIVQNKTLIYSMPDWLVNHELVNHFLRGYIDGDGSYSIIKAKLPRTVDQLAFQLIGTEKCMKQISEILKTKCNMSSSVIKEKDKKTYKISYSGNKSIKRLYEFLYKDSMVYLDRKQKIINFANQE